MACLYHIFFKKKGMHKSVQGRVLGKILEWLSNSNKVWSFVSSKKLSSFSPSHLQPAQAGVGRSLVVPKKKKEFILTQSWQKFFCLFFWCWKPVFVELYVEALRLQKDKKKSDFAVVDTVKVNKMLVKTKNGPVKSVHALS